MSYTQFNYAVPVTTQTRQETVDSTRENLMALRDAVVMGSMPGWDFSSGDASTTATATATLSTPAATPSIPGVLQYRKGTEEVWVWVTWDGDEYPTQLVYYYSPDTSSGYPANRIIIGTEDITYDLSFNITSVTWTI